MESNMTTQLTENEFRNYSNKNIVCFTLEGIVSKQDKKGIWKKSLLGMPNWKQIDKNNCEHFQHTFHRAIAIITGEISNITGIDFDVSKETGHCAYEDVVKEFPELKKYKTIRTWSGGYHIYCLYDKEINSTTNAFEAYPNIDIRNDGAILFASPTKVFKEGKIAGEYQDLGGEILPFPTELKKKLKQYSHETPAPQPPQPPVFQSPSRGKENQQPFQNQEAKGAGGLAGSNYSNKKQELLELAEIIALEYIDNRSDWLKMIWSLRSESDDNRDIALNLTRKSKHYQDDSYFHQHWNQFKKNSMTIGTFRFYAKKSDKERYLEIIKKYKKPTMIQLTDLKDIFKTAEIVSKTLKEKLILCKEKWFILDDKTELWAHVKDPTYHMTREVRDCVDELQLKNSAKLCHEKNDEKREELQKNAMQILKMYEEINRPSYSSQLSRYLRTLLVDNDFEAKLDATPWVLAFKNGIMDLKSKEFREGIQWDDYLTATIPHNYVKGDEQKMDFVKGVMKQIMNNNDEHLEYFLAWIGYNMIGVPHLEKALMFHLDLTECGKGDNGKTLFFDIFTSLMPNYFYKSKSVFLEEGNTKVHKQLAEMKGKRCVWLDELSKKKQNSELMKELADGKKIENEVMYGTSEAINILFKLNGLSNFKPKIEAEQQATYNRYRQISYHSHFDKSGARKVANPEKLEFIADTHLCDKLLNDYKHEILQLLIDYAYQYGVMVYNEDKQEWKMRGLPPIPVQFREEAEQTKQSNDDFGMWFENNLEAVEDARVSKYEILQCYKNEKELEEGMKRKGYKYDKELKGFEIKKTHDGKVIKGGWKGVRFVKEEEP